MNDEFVSYLNEIGMSSTLQERVAKLHDEFIWIMPDAIERIFVTDYIHSEDGRRYENLWFLSKNYCSEMKGFISNDNGDLIRTEGRVMYIEIMTFAQHLMHHDYPSPWHFRELHYGQN